MKQYIYILIMCICGAIAPQKMWADSQFTYTAKSDLSSTFQSAFGSYGTVTCDTWTDANTAVAVTVAGTVTSIGEDAFRQCYALTSITIPEGVTSIGNSAFCSCHALTSINIPNGVTSIGGSAFSNCSGLTSITIPSSVTSIGGDAFYTCSGLESITVAEGNTAYKSEDNCLLTKDGLTLIKGCKNSVIPSGVTNISDDAFNACHGLTSITIPKSVTSIQDKAFDNCSNLTTITVLSSNATLGYLALLNCDNLKTIYVPAGSVATYKAATNWSDYAAKIKAIPTLAFDLAITKAGATEATLSKELVKTITINRSAAGAAQVAAQSGSEEVTPTALEHLARYDFTITKLPTLQPGEDVLEGGIVAKAKRRVATAATPPSEPTLSGPALVVGTATAYTTYPLDAENPDIKVQMLTNGNMLVGGIEMVGVTSIYFVDAHQLTATPAVAKTCTTDGNSAYWYCSTCKKYFSDEACTTVIEENSWVIPASHEYVNGECTVCHMRESVTYRVPTYNTAGVPTSGIASWNESATAQNVKPVTSSTDQVTWTAGWYYVSGNVTLTKGAVCSGAVHLILCDGAKLTVTQSENQQAGINVSGDDNSLTTYAQSEGEQMGVLSANGGNEGAGIGGGRCGSGQNITINGGTVTANGGDHGAGIGGGVYRSGSYITINGGAVTANGGNEGAGIGGGNEGSGQNITINGGTVTANGGNEGAGIGGGRRGSGSNITINGGTVTATSNDRGGAGIGGGSYGSGSYITINGGTVTANGSRQQSDILHHGPYVYGAGIGNGCDCVVADSHIYISTDLITLAGSSANPTDEILHYGNDISVALAGKPYALVKAEEFEQLATATVTDGETYSRTTAANVGTLTYKRTVNESQVGKWQALYVPFQMGYDDWCDDFDVATIQNFHDYTEDAVLEVRLVKSGTLMESHPYLIRPKTAGEKTITVQNTTLARPKNISVVCQSMEYKYTFTGIYEPMQNLKTSGYLYLTGGQLQQAIDDQTMLEAQRWYLAIESLDGLLETVPSGAKAIKIRVLDEENESAGIVSYENENDNANNRKYLENGKVVIILNGKKYNVNGQVIK